MHLNASWLNFLQEAQFAICSVVLDKNAHKARYKEPMHPYHYCLNILLHQYLSFLKVRHFVGDVKAEARGRDEDRGLQEEFSHFFKKGKSKKVQEYFTSKEIKFSTKKDMVCGVELADMLVSPLKKYTLKRYEEHPNIISTGSFDYQVLQKVENKIKNSQFIQ